MARTTRRKGIGGPFKGRTPKVVEPVVAKDPLPETKEGLIEALSKLCDEVDAQLELEISADRKVRTDRSFRSYWQQHQPWRGLFDRRDALTRALGDMLTDDDGDFSAYVRKQLRVHEIGTVPTFARPGFFVIWIDFIPLGCAWDGFAYPRGEVYAIDPDRPWVNVEGEKWVNENIGAKDLTVELLFRNEIEEWTKAVTYVGKKRERTPHFQLVALTSVARAQAGALLEGMPELRPILKRGPVNAIPMPSHIKSVQMALA